MYVSINNYLILKCIEDKYILYLIYVLYKDNYFKNKLSSFDACFINVTLIGYPAFHEFIHFNDLQINSCLFQLFFS